jgi:histidine triad (HIT) family protein
MQESIFTKIIRGEIPSYKIYEDEYTFAFLDIRPNTSGHTLVVPKKQVDYFADVPEPYYSAVFQTAKKLAPAIQKATKCIRVGTIIAGFEVPHFHYHLIPMTHIGDLDSAKAHDVSQDELAAMAEKICSYL